MMFGYLLVGISTAVLLVFQQFSAQEDSRRQRFVTTARTVRRRLDFYTHNTTQTYSIAVLHIQFYT